ALKPEEGGAPSSLLICRAWATDSYGCHPGARERRPALFFSQAARAESVIPHKSWQVLFSSCRKSGAGNRWRCGRKCCATSPWTDRLRDHCCNKAASVYELESIRLCGRPRNTDHMGTLPRDREKAVRPSGQWTTNPS